MTFHCEQLLEEHLQLSLSASQRDALKQLLTWRDRGENGVLEGFAGTGKTTVLLALIMELEEQGDGLVFVAAPTHKAAKVLNDKINDLCSRADIPAPVQVVTIHSLLGLRPKRSRPDQPEGFSSSGRVSLEIGSYLILDECSMVGRELYKYVLQYAEEYQTTVLFTGDPKQLRPVNESNISPAFQQANKVQLTEVVRHGGAVLKLATQIRTMHRFAWPVVRSSDSAESRVVAYTSIRDLFDEWLGTLKQIKDKGEASMDACVMLCWTNKQRRWANKHARFYLYGEDVPPFMAGDRLVMIRPYGIGDLIILQNNQDILVESAELKQCEVPDLAYTYSAWVLRVQGVAHPVFTLVDDEHKKHAKDVKELGKEISAAVETATLEYEATARVLKKEGYKDQALQRHPVLIAASHKLREAKHRWASEYFPLKEFFAEVDFSYALTVHKSQGSTYKSVYVHEDLLQSGNERPQLLYVAITRASQEVHHLKLPAAA